MNGEESDSEFDPLEADPLGIISPSPPVAENSGPVSFCEECGGIGLHLSHCPIPLGNGWVRKELKRNELLAAADMSLPQLAVAASRRIVARVLRRIARSLDA